MLTHQRQEPVRLEQATPRMRPADECLHTDDRSAPNVDLGLEEHGQFAVFDGVPQLAEQVRRIRHVARVRIRAVRRPGQRLTRCLIGDLEKQTPVLADDQELADHHREHGDRGPDENRSHPLDERGRTQHGRGGDGRIRQPGRRAGGNEVVAVGIVGSLPVGFGHGQRTQTDRDEAQRPARRGLLMTPRLLGGVEIRVGGVGGGDQHQATGQQRQLGTSVCGCPDQ